MSELKGCPFCGCAMYVHSSTNWHCVSGPHADECLWDHNETFLKVPFTDAGFNWLVEVWNTRAEDAQITQLKERVDEYAVAIFNALPGPYYMDPPDGGDVSLAEQLKRMAVDAAKYRAQLAQPAVNSGAVPDILFDSWAVLQEITAKERRHTGPENVTAVLDAIVRLLRPTTVQQQERG